MMKKRIQVGFYSLLLAATPLWVFAQGAGSGCGAPVRSLSALVNFLLCTFQSVVPLLFVAALIYFLYGAITFIRADDKTRDEARNKIVYGLVGLFVMLSVWGLVGVLTNTFQLDPSTDVVLPAYPKLR